MPAVPFKANANELASLRSESAPARRSDGVVYRGGDCRLARRAADLPGWSTLVFAAGHLTILRTHPPSASAGAGPRGFAVGAEVPSPRHGRRLPLLRTVHVPCVLPSLPRRDRRLRVSLASPTTPAF